MALSYGFCLGDENSLYTSRQFADAFHAVAGSGVTRYGGKFAVSATDTMQLALATGFALVAGRWVKSDSTQSLAVQPADNNFDRYDAVIIRADISKKDVTILVVKGEASAFPKPYTPVRSSSIYELVLCSIMVRMGASQIQAADLVDARSDAELCGFITPVDVVSNDIIYIDRFLRSGIDEEVAALENEAQDIADDADRTIQVISGAMVQANISKSVGEIEVLRTPPVASSWLLCDGSPIPPQYAVLSALVGGKMPALSTPHDRYQVWMYAGEPTGA